MLPLYRLGVWAYRNALRAAAPWNAKARLWSDGRKNWRTTLARQLADRRPEQPLFWIHCASLGEFEQGRPVLEAWRERHPEQFILLTFFSPSGYEIRKDYAHADAVAYLPPDGQRNARDFLDLVRPDRAIFVKYEFWYFYLNELRRRSIPTCLVSAVFRPEQLFFKSYGGFWRRMLACFTQIFVQDERSEELLAGIGVASIRTGDTRVDRVLNIAENAKSLPLIEHFLEGKSAFVIGSGWEADMQVLREVLNYELLLSNGKTILAPHDVSPANVARLSAYFPTPPLLYSELTEETDVTQAQALVIDSVGLLSSVYQFARVAYVGGGFGSGLHNILEPIAFGVPVLFGPNHEKFPEAAQLLQRYGARVVRAPKDALVMFRDLAVMPQFRAIAKRGIQNFLTENRGATERVVEHIDREF